MRRRTRLTTDKQDQSIVLTVEQLGPKRAKTPSGAMICYDVPIARTGWMIYAPGQVPISPSPDHPDYIRVYRGPDELFRPETIASFAGVAITDDHPDDAVNPENWQTLSHGFSLHNIRRGEGEYDDCLMADIIITSSRLIQAVEDGLREVSCGYEADYEEESPGVGLQSNIIGNHIALVEKGRCGPRCAISDRATETKGTPTMGTRVKLHQRQRTALRRLVEDAESLLEESSDPGSMPDDGDDDTGGTHIHIHAGGATSGGDPAPSGDPADIAAAPSKDEDPDAGGDPIEARFQAIEGQIAQLTELVKQALGGGDGAPPPSKDSDEEAPPEGDPTKDADEEDEDAKMTTDSAALANSYQSLIADAEVLVPGFRVPTFDSKAKRKVTVDNMCQLRRRVLDTCLLTTPGKQLVDSVAGADFSPTKATCAAVATAFKAAAGAQRLLNNRKATGDAGTVPNHLLGHQPIPGSGKIVTVQDLNKLNAEFWAKQGVTA